MPADWKYDDDYDPHVVALMNADLDDVFPELEECE